MNTSMCRSFRRALPFLLLSTSLWLAPTARPAAGLALIPNSISNTYSGQVTLQITGLTNGETVLIERFLDLNANGSPDSGESLAQSFQLTDGLVTSFGGIPDTDIPGDNDAAAHGPAPAAGRPSPMPRSRCWSRSARISNSSPAQARTAPETFPSPPQRAPIWSFLPSRGWSS